MTCVFSLCFIRQKGDVDGGASPQTEPKLPGSCQAPRARRRPRGAALAPWRRAAPSAIRHRHASCWRSVGSYDAFGLIGTNFTEFDWKTLIFFERAVPISSNAWYNRLQRRAGRGGMTAPPGSSTSNLKIHRVDPESESPLRLFIRDPQSNCWANLRILGSTL